MGELAERMQFQLKKSSKDLVTLLLKVFSGLVLGLTFSLILVEALGRPEKETDLTFLFVLVMFAGVFLRVAKKWTLAGILVFDLVCILIGIVLRMYILIAPGA